MSRPASAPAATSSVPVSASRWAVALCWVAVALDGFDLVVLGAVIPTLLREQVHGFTADSANLVATVGLVGVGLGAVAVGPITDRFGRRVTLIGAIAAFSVLTLLVPLAPNVVVFGLLRFLAGLGLGACLPTALTLMTEHARRDARGTAVTRTMTGYHAGAVLTALLAIWLIPHLGWQSLFVVGGALGLVSLPFFWTKLPESPDFVARRQTREKAPAGSIATVLSARYLRISLGLWAASFMGLLLVYGLNTWLPKIMEAAGYDTGASLAFLLVLNLGAVTGLFVAGRLSDRRGTKPVGVVWFAVAAVFLALLSIRMESVAVLYVAVFLAGVFVFSAQVMVYAFVGHLFPARVRGTALGMSAGVGRVGAIVGPFVSGALVSAGIAYPWGFYVFAAAALLGAVALVMVPNREADEEPVTA